MTAQRVITIGAGYGDNIAYFHFRPITVAEEDAFITAMGAFASEPDAAQKAEKELAVCIESLEKWSASPLTRKAGEGDKEGVDKPAYPKSASFGVAEFFESLGGEGHRLATELIYAYRLKLQPTVVFR